MACNHSSSKLSDPGPCRLVVSAVYHVDQIHKSTKTGSVLVVTETYSLLRWESSSNLPRMGFANASYNKPVTDLAWGDGTDLRRPTGFVWKCGP